MNGIEELIQLDLKELLLYYKEFNENYAYTIEGQL